MSHPPPASSRDVSGVAKAKSRTASSIPAMRATGVLREAPPSALATAGAPRSDKLEEEAKRMEERLKQLKVAMTTEKQKREAITKTKAGTFWKGANPVSDNKSYMEDVLARVEKRIAKSNAIGANQKAAAPAAAAGAAAAGGDARAQQRPAAAAAAAGSAGRKAGGASASGVTALDATVKSSYVPPLQPKNPISAPSAPRPQQPEPSSTAAATAARGSAAAPSAPPSARSTARGATSNASGGLAAAASAPAPFVNPADDDTRTAAAGSLLDGHFDEAENKRAFEEARQQWMEQSAAAATAGAGGAKGTADSSSNAARAGRTQLVHDPDYSPAELATSSSSSTGAHGGVGSSLLDGPSFDERESAREFQEARRAWMHSLAEGGGAAATAGALAGQASSRKHVNHAPASLVQDNSDGMWNPHIALGSGGSVLFPSEAAGSEAADPSPHSHAPVVSSALRSQQSSLEHAIKHSCYHCYKLFYATSSVSDSVDFPGKPFCSPDCLEATARTTKIRCAGQGCTKSVLRDQGTRYEGRIMCAACANNAGQAVPAAAAAVALASPPSPDAAPLSSSSATPEPNDDAGDEDDLDATDEDDSAARRQPEEVHSSRPANAQAAADLAARPATAARPPTAGAPSQTIPTPSTLSRPTTASTRAVLDTSVIHVAPAGSGPPVVEFPSDDED